MVRTDGKFMIVVWALMLLSVHQVYSASLELRVQDVHGHQVNEIGVGQPLTVSVLIKGTDGKDLQPIIRTKPTIALQRAGQNMTLLGKNTVAIQYIYRSYIDTPGTYTIGPATIVYQGNTISSNVLTIQATDQPIGSVNGAGDEKQDVFFELATDVRTAIVGQKIPITLTFYYRDKSVRVINVQQPSTSQFILKGDEHGVFGTQDLRGIPYNFIRWDCYIIAHNTGRILIPAHSVDYEIEKKASGRFGGLSFFFDSGYESKRAYSNAVTVTVDPLPQHSGPVLAIGTFESAKLIIEPSVAQEGQAMVLSLDITGDTQWDALKSPELVGVPEGLRCYDSKNYMRKSNNATTSTKRFEYIVQGLKSGTWQIPAQEFTVFDVSARKYKTIRTGNIVVTIEKNNTAPIVLNTDKKSLVVVDTHDTTDVLEEDLLPINQQGPWSSVPRHASIPIWLFMVLVLLPIFCFGVNKAYGRWHGYRISREAQYRSRRAFTTARTTIQQAQKKNEVRALYYIFITLFADYYSVDSSHVSEAFIEHKVRACAVSENLYAQWQEFFVRLSSQVFSMQSNVGSPQLFASAKTWVDLWEKLL